MWQFVFFLCVWLVFVLFFLTYMRSIKISHVKGDGFHLFYFSHCQSYFYFIFLWEGQVEDALGAVMLALKGFVHFKWLYSAETKCAPTTKKSAYLIFVIWASFRMRTCAFLLYNAIRKITCNEYLIIFYIYIPRWAFVSNWVRCSYV